MREEKSQPHHVEPGHRAILCSRHFLRSWSRLPRQQRKQVQAKIHFLAQSPAHPSFQAYRLMYPSGTIWGCRLSRGMRLFYQFDTTHLYVLDIGRHEIVERLPQRSYLDEHHWSSFE